MRKGIRIRRNQINRSSYKLYMLLAELPALIIGIIFLAIGLRDGYTVFWAIGLGCIVLALARVIIFFIRRHKAKQEHPDE